MTPAAQQAYGVFTKKREHNGRLMGSLFNDSAYVRQQVDDGTLNYYLYKLASILQDTRLEDSLHLFRIFTDEELYHIWQKENAWWYISFLTLSAEWRQTALYPASSVAPYDCGGRQLHCLA